MSNKKVTSQWFEYLRDQICQKFEELDGHGKFIRKKWQRDGGGGGEMSLMNGKIFEKVGVNVSTVFGNLSPELRPNLPGTEKDGVFFATGISIVAHMCSPLVPAVHMNTRYIETGKSWFGGGSDLNPSIENIEDTEVFHKAFEIACNKHNPEYYQKFKAWADEYFFIKHRKEARGVGGIFFDYLNSEKFADDFAFTQDVGKTFLKIYPEIVAKHMNKTWTEEQRDVQLIKRGRYAEFNLVYDRGTKFGFLTGGNIEAILMSLPPLAKWS